MSDPFSKPTLSPDALRRLFSADPEARPVLRLDHVHGDPSDIDGPQDDEWINEAYYRQHPKESQ